MTEHSLFIPLPIFETEHLILRDLRLDDAQDQLEYAQDDEIAGFGLWPPQKTLQENLDDIQEVLKYYATGTHFTWAVEHRSDRKMIGRLGLGGYNPRDARADVGYAYNRLYWGKGYATEAARAVLQFGFDRLTLHRVGAAVLPDNFGSIRVLEKLGFQREGVRRQAYSLRGPYEDLLCYSILAPEWRELNR
jgi:[ribosomal protein S5]-alanine N-acetyltransferase